MCWLVYYEKWVVVHYIDFEWDTSNEASLIVLSLLATSVKFFFGYGVVTRVVVADLCGSLACCSV
jgi:hypothetical protein